MEGSTYVKLPDVFRLEAVDIGFVFYLFLAMLAVFSTNAINIYAGINGLEVGQSVVIAGSLICNNVIQLSRLDPTWIIWENHLFSLYLLLPFTASSLALYAFNKYPAQVFVGDTFCYLAGMTIAASGVIGQNSKTVILFLGPQVINFIYSLPQLFKVVQCPRHRMPAFIEQGELVGVSFTDWMTDADLSFVSRNIISVLENLNLALVERKSPNLIRVQNLTILNFVLWKLGPMKEAKLTEILLLGQTLWSLIALFIRYGLARLFYQVVY
jgi:UDP-N-acetylglucosamine--dolichyl-phosphate N-acetylglucosaminephosphotransferase